MVLHPQARAAVGGRRPSRRSGHPATTSPPSAPATREAAWPGRARTSPRSPTSTPTACRAGSTVPARALGGTMVHLHGGGFVFNDVDVHDAPARLLANRTGIAVLSVDYRRPPEHRFPAAPDDVDTVARAGSTATAPSSGSAARRTSHGDSAGGNLALVAALRHPGRFAAVVLIYPFLDPTAGFDSYRTARRRLRPARGRVVLGAVRRRPADLTDPDLAPLLSDRLGTLPPTLVVTAEHDPLRDEGEHLAAAARRGRASR